MSLREDVELYTKLSGEDGSQETIATIGAYLRGYGQGKADAEPKRGKWIKTARWGRVYYCDQCRNYLDFDGVNAGRGSTNYCPNCGADMREVTT